MIFIFDKHFIKIVSKHKKSVLIHAIFDRKNPLPISDILIQILYMELSGETFLRKGSSDGGAPLCHCVTSPRTAGSHPRAPFQRLLSDFFSDRARKK